MGQIVGQIFFAEVECVHAIIRQVAEEIWLRHASKLGGGADGAKFDTTPGAFQSKGYLGHGDAFVFKLNPYGTRLLYSTLVF